MLVLAAPRDGVRSSRAALDGHPTWPAGEMVTKPAIPSTKAARPIYSEAMVPLKICTQPVITATATVTVLCGPEAFSSSASTSHLWSKSFATTSVLTGVATQTRTSIISLNLTKTKIHAHTTVPPPPEMGQKSTGNKGSSSEIFLHKTSSVTASTDVSKYNHASHESLTPSTYSRTKESQHQASATPGPVDDVPDYPSHEVRNGLSL